MFQIYGVNQKLFLMIGFYLIVERFIQNDKFEYAKLNVEQVQQVHKILSKRSDSIITVQVDSPKINTDTPKMNEDSIKAKIDSVNMAKADTFKNACESCKYDRILEYLSIQFG